MMFQNSPYKREGTVRWKFQSDRYGAHHPSALLIKFGISFRIFTEYELFPTLLVLVTMGRWKPPVFYTTEEYSKWAFYYVKKLARIIPSLSIASIIIRLGQLALMIALSLAYASGSPGVYHDVLIWEKNVSAPYQVTVYRNFTSWGEIRRLNLSETGNTAKGGFIWNSNKTYPGCERYTCDDTRWDCNGSQWQSSRVGFGDSEGFNRAESQKSTFVLDRAVFGMVVTLVSPETDSPLRRK